MFMKYFDIITDLSMCILCIMIGICVLCVEVLKLFISEIYNKTMTIDTR